MKEEFLALLRSVDREGMDELINFIEKSDFFKAPASTRFHGSYEGGLLEHSLNVYKLLCEKVKNCPVSFKMIDKRLVIDYKYPMRYKKRGAKKLCFIGLSKYQMFLQVN